MRGFAPVRKLKGEEPYTLFAIVPLPSREGVRG
jgi:hypothetical protein